MSEIKKSARGLLMSGWGRHILISLALIAVFFVCGELSSAFSGSASRAVSGVSSGTGAAASSAASGAGAASSAAASGLTSIILSAGISFVLLLLASLFVYGALYYFLKVIRKEEYSFRDIAHAFKDQPDKYLILSLILVGVYVLATLPLRADLPLARPFQIIWLIAGIIFTAFIFLTLAMAPFLMFDHENMGVSASIRESARLMSGKKKALLGLLLTFIGYVLLGICSFAVGFLWIIPYMMASVAVFYNSLKTNNR